jgi:hypothetical protein
VFCGIEKMMGMIKGVKADHIGMQHALYKIFNTLELPENLGSPSSL